MIAISLRRDCPEDDLVRPMFPLILTAMLGTAASGQGTPAVEFEFETLGGQSLSEADFEANVLLLDFWGTWCPPCKESIPVLQGLYAKYKHYGFEIVGLTYEGAGDDAADGVREFAAERGITYPLAMGTPAHKQVVPGKFGGYPTLLFFDRGLEFDHAKVGFQQSDANAIEDWIRAKLGLEAVERTGRPADAAVAGAQTADGELEPLNLPAGVVFMPGDGDTGFEFEVEDAEGNTLKFAAMRGKPVVLALTSTWDASATLVAAAMKSLDERYPDDDAIVLAASLELRGSREKKVGKINAFRAEHELLYPSFPAGIGFQKKVHQFSGMPMFLVFDQDGVLVVRESGSDGDAEEGKGLDATREKIEQTVDGLLGR